MRVVVDGFNLALEKGTGVATYARNLTYNVGAMGHEVEVLYGSRRSPDFSKLMREIAFFDENVGSVPLWVQRLRAALEAVRNPFSRAAYEVPLSGTVIYKQYSSRLPHFDRLLNAPNIYDQAPHFYRWFRRAMRVSLPQRAALMHWTYPLPLRVRGMPNIYTLHDLVPLRLPFTTLDHKREYFRLCRYLSRKAAHIVTVSENSRNDIINLLGVPEHKITNTYQSVDIPARYLDIPVDVLKDELKGTFRLDYKGYLLFYGSIEPKKNIGRIIEAYLSSNLDIPLVIVGAQAWKSEQELRLLVDDNIRSLVQIGPETLVRRKVVRLDYVTFPQLVNLIRGAVAVTFPSLYEGFGLPVVEGMICETPVITSDAHSTKEIAGDAALLVDPYNTRQIKDAMLSIVNNQDLRAEIAAKGKREAVRFSAEAYQKRLAEVYTRVADQSAIVEPFRS